MRRAAYRTLFVLALLSASATGGGAQRARAALRVAPASLYPEMIRLADRGEWTGLARATELLAPLLAAIDSTMPDAHGTALRRNIEARATDAVRANVMSLALAGVIMELRDSQLVRDVDARRAMVKTAFAEYLAVAPSLSGDTFRISQEISRSFRDVNSLAGLTGERYASGVAQLVAQLERAGVLHVKPGTPR